MSTLATNAITDASGGNTATINSYTPTESNMAGRNRIINGGMNIWQRGTSSLSSGSDRYVADRWQITPPAAVSTDVTQEFNTTLQSYLMRVKVNATGVASFRQKIEGFKQFHNKDVTYSFKALGNLFSNVTVSVRLYHSGGNVLLHSATHDLTGSLTDITGSLSIGDVSSYTEDASSSLGLLFSTDSSSTGAYIDITQVQLEAGSVATPFERRQYGQELALCQRYAYVNRLSSSGTFGFGGFFETTTAAVITLRHPVEMRASPTFSFSAANTFFTQTTSNITPSAISLQSASTFGGVIDATVSGATAGNGFHLIRNIGNGTEASITASAEL